MTAAREVTESVVIRLNPRWVNVTRHALKVHPKHQTGEERSTSVGDEANCEYCSDLQRS